MRPRLAELLKMIAGHTVADIGCDHGLLCEALLLQGHHVIGTDVSQASLDKARHRLKNHTRFEARKGDGFDPLNHGEADCVVIAGVGATTITGILQRAGNKAHDTLLILQPMQDTAQLRGYLKQNGFGLLQERLIREDRRYYPIIAAQYGKGLLQYPDWMQEGGPLLMQQRHPLLNEYLHWRLKVYGDWQQEGAQHVREVINWLTL